MVMCMCSRHFRWHVFTVIHTLETIVRRFFMYEQNGQKFQWKSAFVQRHKSFVTQSLEQFDLYFIVHLQFDCILAIQPHVYIETIRRQIA